MANSSEDESKQPSEDILESFMRTVLNPVVDIDKKPTSPDTNSDPLTLFFEPVSLLLDMIQGTTLSEPEKKTNKKNDNTETNNESNPISIFDQIKKWLDLGSEYNKSLLTQALDTLTNPPLRYNNLIEHFTTLSKHLLQGDASTPANLVDHHLSLMQKQLTLGQNTVRRLIGVETAPIITPSKTDHRFNDEQWENNDLFDYIKQSYLLNSQFLLSLTDCLGIEKKKKASLDYYFRQISSAMSPSNFALINPEVLKKIKETKGKNIYQGIKQFLEDQANSPQILNICMSGGDRFQLGQNIAATTGKVIFENSLMQLIQYQATTKKTHTVPLLIIPSWINKYYILDLSPNNSFVEWAVNQGHTVFMISWINPDQRHRDIGFDDYLQQGVLTAIDTITKATGEKKVNTVGYCLGGILLATVLSYLSFHKKDSIASATYLAASLDYSDPGDISIFLNESSVKTLESIMEKDGFLDGRLMSITFNLLRENDLYWNYYIQNYLKGERPKAFDVLHWSTDNTNIPARAHSYVLRELHLKNALKEKDSLSLLDTPIDLGRIKNPVYILATDKDHIAKWESVYSSTQLHCGEKRFVLAGSGHIAGVINSPANNKYYYHVNSDLPQSPDNWLEKASKLEGSWWNDWLAWVSPHSGNQVKARSIPLKSVIENAPGRYVRRRLS